MNLLFGIHQDQVLSMAFNATSFMANMAIVALNFLNPIWLFAIPGILLLRKYPNQSMVWILYGITFIHFIFFVRYFVPDQALFVLPTITMLSISCAWGLKVASTLTSNLRYRLIIAIGIAIVGASPLVYQFVLHVVRATGVEIRRERVLPFRDEARYWILPWKHDESSAEQFSHEALLQAEPDGIIFADSSTEPALVIMQTIYGMSPSVEIIEAGPKYRVLSVFKQAEKRKVFVVSPSRRYAPDELLDQSCDIEKEGVLYRVYWECTTP